MTYQRQYRAQDPSRYSAKLKEYYQNRWRHPQLQWIRMACGSAKARARRMGVLFDLTYADLAPALPDVCPVLGIPLQYERVSGKLHDNSPTLDRIDNTKGYAPGNVVVVSWRANKIKGNATVDELEAVANFYRRAKFPRTLRELVARA